MMARILASIRRHWALGAAAAFGTAAVLSVFIPLPRDAFRPTSVQSLRIMDSRGVPLRTFLNDRQGRGQWRTLPQIAPELHLATIAAEDRRFRYHPGVDPIAVVRAAMDNIRAGRILSGGSTITQQVIRNVFGLPRTYRSKAVEAWYALRLDRMFSKDEILEQYLNRAPYGNQTFGAEAASQLYFGKPAARLSLAEAAFLAALPNAPSTLNPYRNPEKAAARQVLVLRRMRDEGMITEEEFGRANAQPLLLVRPEVSFRAPHAVVLAAAEAERITSTAEIRTTIDDALQTRVQEIVRAHLAQLARRNVTNASVVVLDNATGAIRALLGSADYFDELHGGQVNGAVAPRQPGSAIKPFTYSVAFEAGMHPADVVADIPTQIPDRGGDYVPENYDRKYHGPVRLRTALACSYNIPAVRVLRSVGKELLWQRLQDLGFSTIAEGAEHYGLGLTLGNAEVTLLDLTTAYAALARGGEWKPAFLVERLRTQEGAEIITPLSRGTRVIDARAAFLVTDVLSDPAARRPAFGNAFRFPFPCAVKTGTTKDYRDNWTVGYTTRYTVGVWAGNFDGSPMRGVSGVSGAGGIFSDVMILLHGRESENTPPPFPVPADLVERSVCTVSGRSPGPSCTKTVRDWFIRGHEPRDECRVHRSFLVQESDGVDVERVFEILPGEYAAWIQDQRVPQPPPGARESVRPDERRQRRSALSILSPNDGDVFKLDPVLRREYQALKVLANVPPDTRDVYVRVDESEVIPVSSSGFWWTLQKGTHRMRLEGRRGDRSLTSRAVTIVVE